MKEAQTPVLPPQESDTASKSTADTLARAYASEAIGVQVEVMRNGAEKAADRLRAAQDILDRGFGKPTSTVVTLPARANAAHRLASMSDSALLAVVQAARVAATAAEATGDPATDPAASPSTPQPTPQLTPENRIVGGLNRRAKVEAIRAAIRRQAEQASAIEGELLPREDPAQPEPDALQDPYPGDKESQPWL